MRKRRIVFILLIIALIFLGIWGYKKYQNHSQIKQVEEYGWSYGDPAGVKDTSEEDTIKSNTPSDIEGMSQLDKEEMGLDYHDGSDSDFDGLSDKDEIEVYGTDPLKASTSGDLYTDGYKVKNNIDVNTVIEGNDEFEFTNQFPKEIIATPSTADDMNAVIIDIPADWNLGNEDFSAVAVYNVSGFGGKLAFDTTETSPLSLVKIRPSDGDKFIDCGTSSESGKLVLDYEFDINKSYYVDIVSSDIVLNNSDEDTSVSSQNHISGVLFVRNPMLGMNLYPTIYYVDDIKDSNQQAVLEANLEWVIGFTNQYMSKFSTYEPIDRKSTHVKGISTLSYKLKKEIKESLFSVFEYDGNPDNGKFMKKDEIGEWWFNGAYFKYNYLGMWFDPQDLLERQKQYTKDDTTTAEEHEKELSKKEIRYNGVCDNFNTNYGNIAFPFGNFSPSKAPNGVCAGWSYYIAKLHNDGSMPASGNYNGESWNFATDLDNMTLLDEGLSDYKTADWVKNHQKVEKEEDLGDYIKTTYKFDESSLSSGERDFVNCLVSYWDQYNSVAASKVVNDYDFWEQLSFNNFENVIPYFEDKKVLLLNMAYKDNGQEGIGHTVVLYGMHYVKYSEEEDTVYNIADIEDLNAVVLEIIDPNAGYGQVLCYRTPIQTANGTRDDGFRFRYFPNKGNFSFNSEHDKYALEIWTTDMHRIF